MLKKILVTSLFSGLVFAGCSSQPSQNSAPADESTESQETEMMEQTDTMTEDNGDTAMMEKDAQYTLADIAEHATADDCWFAIEGKVYNVTDFIASGKHGGGDAIIKGCGLDATEMFNNRDGEGSSHSETARSFLPNFEIGTLVESK